MHGEGCTSCGRLRPWAGFHGGIGRPRDLQARRPRLVLVQLHAQRTRIARRPISTTRTSTAASTRNASSSPDNRTKAARTAPRGTPDTMAAHWHPMTADICEELPRRRDGDARRGRRAPGGECADVRLHGGHVRLCSGEFPNGADGDVHGARLGSRATWRPTYCRTCHGFDWDGQLVVPLYRATTASSGAAPAPYDDGMRPDGWRLYDACSISWLTLGDSDQHTTSRVPQ